MDTQASLLGGCLLALYVYYTAWVILTPFVDRDVPLFHDLFPDRWWALAVPTALMIAAVAFVFGFVGLVHLRGDAAVKGKPTVDFVLSGT